MGVVYIIALSFTLDCVVVCHFIILKHIKFVSLRGERGRERERRREREEE